MSRKTASGVLGVVITLLTPLVPIGVVLLSVNEPLLARANALAVAQRAVASVVLALPLAVYGFLSALLARRALKDSRGMPGRTRVAVLGWAGAVYGALGALLGAAVPQVIAPLPGFVTVTASDMWITLPRWQLFSLLAVAGPGALAALVAAGAAFGMWWLISPRVRRVFWLIVDVPLYGALIYLWSALWFFHRDVTGPRVIITGAAAIRVIFLGMPFVLDQIEHVGFQLLVAARHLRAKKSGFLATISVLSIAAVSVSSCALTTTLSVMGGFRQDLKHKILGNNAHIVIDPPQGRFGDYQPVLAATRQVDDVRGVSPYVSGEVMISSASNLAGAVLRGIDVAHIGDVSELPSNMKVGSLDYLVHPEKLTRLPSSQLGLSLGLPKVTRFDSDASVKKLDAKRLSEELKEIEDEAAALERQAEDMAKAGMVDEKPAAEDKQKDEAKGPPALPGIVVGQELARSLRLYLGDEVNVVTPLGELGPTGPMPKSRPFRVAGIFYSGMYEYDMKFAYVTLDSAQRFLGTGNQVNGIEVTVHEPERAQEVAKLISDKLGRRDLRVRPWQELNKNLFGALALEKLAMFIALGINIIVAGFCIFSTLTLMVQEKGREVGVLKALGAPDFSIVTIFVFEGMLIGLFGTVLGLAFGYVACFAMEHFGVRLNPEVYYIDRLPVHIDPSEFLAVGFAAVVVCLIVTIYPAKLASRLRPVDALRYE